MQRLYRSRSDRILAGVCGGIADYFKIDAVLIRLPFLLLLIFTGILPLLIAYLIAIWIIPPQPAGSPPSPRKRLLRSQTHRMIAGVCGGIAEALGTDPTLVRLIAVFLCLVTGFFPLFLAYLAAWIIIPSISE